MRARGLLVASLLVALAFGPSALAGRSTSSAATLGPHGIGTVRFGLAKREAVAELSTLFGAPSGRGVNTGCGARYTEVEWGDLVAEFRSSRFSGFRDVEGGYPLTTPGSPRVSITGSPRVATATYISLGSTLGQARATSGRLRRIGADMWKSPNGLVFVDSALRDPVPASSRIREIKIGTCGDF
jgi:hypothetical protein